MPTSKIKIIQNLVSPEAVLGVENALRYVCRWGSAPDPVGSWGAYSTPQATQMD